MSSVDMVILNTPEAETMILRNNKQIMAYLLHYLVGVGLDGVLVKYQCTHVPIPRYCMGLLLAHGIRPLKF